MRPLADYHTHTRWSHAKGTVVDNYKAAVALGLEEVGIAEHGPNLLFVGVPRRKWRALMEAVKGSPVQDTKLLLNIEANVVSTQGDVDVPSFVKTELDMLLVGLHPRVLPQGMESYWAYYGLRWLALLGQKQRHQLYDTFSEAMINSVMNNDIDIITHPGYGLPIDTKELAMACAKRGTKLEINCRHLGVSGKDIAIAAKIPEIEFVLGSDAHHPEEVGRFDAGVELVKEIGLDPSRIANISWQDN